MYVKKGRQWGPKPTPCFTWQEPVNKPAHLPKAASTSQTHSSSFQQDSDQSLGEPLGNEARFVVEHALHYQFIFITRPELLIEKSRWFYCVGALRLRRRSCVHVRANVWMRFVKGPCPHAGYWTFMRPNSQRCVSAGIVQVCPVQMKTGSSQNMVS